MPTPDSHIRGGLTPRWASFGFTFVNSLGTGIVTNGIFFLTRQSYAFAEWKNYLLAVLLGLTYVVGALAAGPAVAWLRRRFPGLSTRTVLLGTMVLMAAPCTLPTVGAWLDGAGPRSEWPAWALILLYSPLAGVLWPLVESYISGGRRGADLRGTIGWWNVVWSSALVLVFWGVAPLVERHALLAVLLLGGAHMGATVFLAAFAREPAPHAETSHEPHPPVYGRLLVAFRLLLPMSYVVSSALGPYLPGAMDRMGVAAGWQTVVASAWLLPRVMMFIALRLWSGWHGRWGLAVVGGVALLAGFAVCVLANRVASGDAAVGVLLGGLALFGLGMAMIYTGAIYYAMEVGQAEVAAGGKHEALIGAGYTVGPVCGLAASVAVEGGVLEPDRFEPLVLGAVGLISIVLAGMVARRVAGARPTGA